MTNEEKFVLELIGYIFYVQDSIDDNLSACKWYGDKQVCCRCRSGNLYATKDEMQTQVITNTKPYKPTEGVPYSISPLTGDTNLLKDN